MMLDVVVIVVVVLAGPCALTTAGGRRRGFGWALAAISGLAFPIAWTVWYLRDEQPYRFPNRLDLRSAERSTTKPTRPGPVS